MATSFYIDANRGNCLDNSDGNNNNEWTYKMSNALQLPTGSEIAIQDTFIHKQGISGATIEIEEDIEETLYFSFYLSDNPHFVPKNNSLDNRTLTKITNNHFFKPTFAPFGYLNNIAFNSRRGESNTKTGSELSSQELERASAGSANIGAYHAHPVDFQRVAMFEDDTTGNVRPSFTELSVLNDPYISGYSEDPMMAVFVDTTTTYTNAPTDATFGGQPPNPNIDTQNADPRFKPFVKEKTIFIKKGVYSVAEIADLIDGQLNGKYTNNRNDDLYTDTVVEKENNNTYRGSLENNAFYQKVKAFDRFGDDEGVSTTDGILGSDLQDILSINQATRNATGGFQHDLNYPNTNPTGLKNIGDTHNDCYNIPYTSYQKNLNYRDAGGAVQTKLFDAYQERYTTIPKTYFNAGQTEPLPSGVAGQMSKNRNTNIHGRPPVLPSSTHIMYIPVHYYNQLVKLWRYNELGDDGVLQSNPANAGQNSFLRWGNPGDGSQGNWTVNANSLYRYAFQQRLNYDVDCVLVADGSGGQAPFNGPFIGLHHKIKVNNQPTYYHTNAVADGEEGNLYGVLPAPYSYKLMNDGYYLGTPDFSFTYDDSKSAFSVSGLHQNLRVPSCDFQGNPMNSEGQTAVYLRRHSKLQQDIFTACNKTQATITSFGPSAGYTPAQQAYVDAFNKIGGQAGYRRRLESSLQANESRLGGVAVYNWASDTAKKLGDVSPDEIYLDADGNPNRKYDSRFTYLWKFQDYFSTVEKAKQAWETTIWSRLGFTYDNLQNDDSWETCPYYDIPEELITDTSPYVDTRVNMRFFKEDFKVYGKTTKGDIGADSAPTVSSVFNSAIYSYTPKPTESPAPSALKQIIRTYDNHDVAQPYYGFSAEAISPPDYPSDAITTLLIDPTDTASDPQVNPNMGTTEFQYDNSMYFGKSRVPVLTESKSILASGLPKLSLGGYYIITSDIVDGYLDDVKQTGAMPLLGVVPISNLSNQDFITTKNDLVHTLQQPKVLNSIKIKILNPDLTQPKLLPNSSVLIRITTPLPENNPMTPDQTDESKSKKQGDTNQPNPHDDKTNSGDVL